MATQIPAKANVVIIGGGIIGLSVAYHLAREGIRDVVLLERKKLTCGTTWHAAGLVTQLRATENMARLAQYTVELFRELERETGQSTGFKTCGSVTVASSQERLVELKRGASMGRSFGLDVQIIEPAAARELAPLLDITGVLGAAYIPSDGKTNPVDTARAFEIGARSRGVKIFEGTKVTDLHIVGDKITGVATERGTIACDVAVICSGMWSREVGVMARTPIPLHAAEHFYIVTEAIRGLNSSFPLIRDLDSCFYAKEDAGKLLVGAFEPKGKAWGMQGIPAEFCFDQLQDDPDHFAPYLEAATRRMPILQEIGLQTSFNGPESFTPDNRFHLGPSAQVDGVYVAAGFNSCGIESSGGAGKVLAEWIAKGYPAADFWEMDVRRAMPFQQNRRYLADRTPEAVGMLFAPHHPYKSPLSARGVRRSPLHEHLLREGACFAEAAGWERAAWFGPPGSRPVGHYTFRRGDWLDAVAREHRATREGVTIFDQTSFAHLLVTGPGALGLMQLISTNDMDVAVGKVVYTPWANERGGIESDVTVARLSENEFLIVTAGGQRIRDLAWLNRHARSLDRHVSVVDVSSGYATVSVMGPKSRELLQRVSPADFSETAFPFATFKEIEIGYATALAFRMTFVGEMGWELHIPIEFTAGIYEALVHEGRSLEVRPAGYLALESLRIESGYRDWGHDVSDEDSPIQAGLGFTVAWTKKAPFIGQQALQAERRQPPKRRLVQFALHDSQPLAYGTEPIFLGKDMVGYLKSGAFGHTLGCSVGMGYVTSESGVTAAWLESAHFEIEIEGARYPAHASLKALYDPLRSRVKGQYRPAAELIPKRLAPTP